MNTPKWFPAALTFIKQAFCENGTPSSSRLISGWLSVSCMALLWFIVRHMFFVEDAGKLGIWVNGLPYIIGAMAVWATSPYGVNKIGSTITSFSKKGLREIMPDAPVKDDDKG